MLPGSCKHSASVRTRLTVAEVGGGVDFPNDLSPVRAVDAAVLIIQKVLRQSLIWEKRSNSCVKDKISFKSYIMSLLKQSLLDLWN